jgi:hypothetical protein
MSSKFSTATDVVGALAFGIQMVLRLKVKSVLEIEGFVFTTAQVYSAQSSVRMFSQNTSTSVKPKVVVQVNGPAILAQKVTTTLGDGGTVTIWLIMPLASPSKMRRFPWLSIVSSTLLH